jgi:hypothetical protein
MIFSTSAGGCLRPPTALQLRRPRFFPNLKRGLPSATKVTAAYTEVTAYTALSARPQCFIGAEPRWHPPSFPASAHDLISSWLCASLDFLFFYMHNMYINYYALFIICIRASSSSVPWSPLT